MMKKFVCFIFAVFAFAIHGTLEAQDVKVSGFYRGFITQNEGGLAEKYTMELNLTISPQGKAVGTSYFKLPDSEEIYVKYSLEGILEGDVLVLQEKSIDEEQNRDGYYFCLKKMEMKVVRKGHEYSLQGSWTSENCPNSRGDIQIKKENIF
jgi:hypothetical protein